MKRLWSEPLLYFVVAGAGLFFLTALFGEQDDNTIVVDREQLLKFVRQQSRDFTPGHAEKRLSSAGPRAFEALRAQYVREEALYREARALGFAEQDYVIRRRLVQRIELLAQGVATSKVSTDEVAARKFFHDNAANYLAADRVTFSHVYFSAGAEAAGHAQNALRTLNGKEVGVANASQYGERFLYHLNYVDRTLDFVSSHFGPDFTRALMEYRADAKNWHGPIQSEHGWHLVLFLQHKPAHLPDFEKVRDQVVTDLRQRQINTLSEELIEETIAKYAVDDRYQLEATPIETEPEPPG